MDVTIYHNPKCGTSRNTLAMLQAAGFEPQVILYLETPPSRDTLLALMADAGLTARDVLRQKGTPYDELGLDDPKWSEDELIDFMMAHPILINRPFVKTPHGVRLSRPSEKVMEILPKGTEFSFTKEDGEEVTLKA